jgi:antitoxin component of MazEF toxin-antitoxin module
MSVAGVCEVKGYHKVVSLQEHKKGNSFQYTLTIPSSYVNILDMKKGSKIKLSLVFGSGMIQMEKADKRDE